MRLRLPLGEKRGLIRDFLNLHALRCQDLRLGLQAASASIRSITHHSTERAAPAAAAEHLGRYVERAMLDVSCLKSAANFSPDERRT